MKTYIIVSVIIIIILVIILFRREKKSESKTRLTSIPQSGACDTDTERSRCCKVFGSWYCSGKSDTDPGTCVFKENDLNGFFSEEECIRQAFCGCPGNCSGQGQCVKDGISGKISCLCNDKSAGDTCQYSCEAKACQVDPKWCSIIKDCGIDDKYPNGLDSEDAFNACLAVGKIPTPDLQNPNSIGWCSIAGECDMTGKVVDKQLPLGDFAVFTYYGSRFPPDFYRCRAAAGCLIGTANIHMADGSHKYAKDIVPGDLVISGLTGKAVRVMCNVISPLDNQQLIGFNEEGPLATIDHNFIRHDGIRMAVNPTLSFLNRYWKEIASADEGETFLNGKKITSIQVYDDNGGDVEGGVVDGGEKDDKVYDIITEDHSYIVNGYPSYDDFPEVEENPTLSLMIFKFLKEYKGLSETNTTEGLSRLVMELYTLSANKISGWLEETRNENVRIKLREFLETYSANNFYLKLASRMWRHYYYKFE